MCLAAMSPFVVTMTAVIITRVIVTVNVSGCPFVCTHAHLMQVRAYADRVAVTVNFPGLTSKFEYPLITAPESCALPCLLTNSTPIVYMCKCTYHNLWLLIDNHDHPIWMWTDLVTLMVHEVCGLIRIHCVVETVCAHVCVQVHVFISSSLSQCVMLPWVSLLLLWQQYWAVCLPPESPPEDTGGVQFVVRAVEEGRRKGIEMNSVFDVVMGRQVSLSVVCDGMPYM